MPNCLGKKEKKAKKEEAEGITITKRMHLTGKTCGVYRKGSWNFQGCTTCR
jgi:hypothetical protein